MDACLLKDVLHMNFNGAGPDLEFLGDIFVG